MDQDASGYNSLEASVIYALMTYAFLCDDDLLAVVTEMTKGTINNVSREDFDQALANLEASSTIIFGQVYGDCWSINRRD